MVRVVREKSSSSKYGRIDCDRWLELVRGCYSPPDATGELRSPARLAGLMEHIDDLAFILFDSYAWTVGCLVSMSGTVLAMRLLAVGPFAGVIGLNEVGASSIPITIYFVAAHAVQVLLIC